MRDTSRWIALAVCGLLACGGDDGGTTSADSGLDAGSADGATAEDGPGTDSGADAGSADGGSADGGDSGDDGSGDGGGGPPCMSSAECAESEFCNFGDQSCGVSGKAGNCAARPTGCMADDRPVCGCDDQVYDGVCSAAAAGQGLKFLGECTPPAGSFPCGFSFCIGGEEYCFEQGGGSPSHECMKLPPVCDAGDCQCMTMCCGCNNATCCSDFCTNGDGQTTITCPG